MKPKRALLSFAVILVGFKSCNRLLTFSVADKVCKDRTQLVVGSYNINFSKPIAFASSIVQEELSNEFNKYLQENNHIDILAVQEHGWRSKAFLTNNMTFPYVHEVENMTVALYSKFPFLNVGAVDFESNVANTCIWADVIINQDTIRIYTAHLESNRHDGKVPPVIDQEAKEKINNAALLGIVKHYQEFSQARANQAQLIQNHKLNSPYPAIICGDFNDTPQSYVYTVLKADMQDSFYEEGNGIGSTFGEKIPALRIDYIFVDTDIEIIDHTISRSTFSDHYLQYSKLEI